MFLPNQRYKITQDRYITILRRRHKSRPELKEGDILINHGGNTNFATNVTWKELFPRECEIVTDWNGVKDIIMKEEEVLDSLISGLMED